jgi:small subunit ribosomal protein S2
MSEATGHEVAGAQPPAPPAPPAADASAADAVLPREKRAVTIRALLEAGAHFGHQTGRWDPKMKPYIFGERDGIHIINLDKTLPRLQEALAFVRETVARGGKILFVGTKRQAQAPIQLEAERAAQFYVNNRWLGGMLTNFRTVKKSIEHFKEELELLGDEERANELSKKERSRVSRSVAKYRKSLDGIRDMTRLPDALFVIDLAKEHIAISEAQRLGIPLIAIVDTNCSPERIDFPIPANDDAIRAIQLYCELVADACLEGAELFNERVQSREEAPAEAAAPTTGRRVVEIKHPTARRSSRQPGGTHSAGSRRREAEDKPHAAAETPAPAPAAPPEPSSE